MLLRAMHLERGGKLREARLGRGKWGEERGHELQMPPEL